jgi:adiponectin receptor
MIEKIDSRDFDWIDIFRDTKLIDNSLGNIMTHNVSRWPIFIFLISAICCLTFSAIFHLCYVISTRWSQVLIKFDYAGISLLISGSTFPPIYYGLYCQLSYGYVYVSVVGAACLIVFFVSLTDKFHSEELRHYKVWTYACLGLLAGLPLVHLL